ncbi:hypothetical protein B0H14DRAFT_2607496 [Mycena olivaceomarginata]|nr:hypothetical protein B0H14DRAFT_2607496 [Mycena olivaceomarginata]
MGCASTVPGNPICSLYKPEDRGWIEAGQGLRKGHHSSVKSPQNRLCKCSNGCIHGGHITTPWMHPCKVRWLQPTNPDTQQHLPHDVWMAMEITEVEQCALGIPQSQIPARFARVTGPDEGADVASQQFGVQRRATVRTAPTPTTGCKKRKGNSGATIPVASGSGSK